MSIHSSVNMLAAALAAVTFGLSTAAWAAGAEHEREETDGHDHAAHIKEHNLDGKGKAAEKTAKSAAPGTTKAGEVLHETEETDGHDHAQHKKDHNQTR